MSEMQMRAAICDTGRRLWQLGLGGGAIVATRVSPKRFLVTPPHASIGHLKPDEIALSDAKGQTQGDIQSPPEAALLTYCLEQRTDAESVILSRCAACTAIGLTGDSLPDNALPEAAYVLGSVPTVPFAMPDAEDAREAIGLYLQDHKTFFLAHIGVLALGKSLTDAAMRVETAERIAQTVINARMLDGVRPLPNDAFNRLLEEGLKGALD